MPDDVELELVVVALVDGLTVVLPEVEFAPFVELPVLPPVLEDVLIELFDDVLFVTLVEVWSVVL